MMNKDTHLLFEAYKKVNEAFEYFGSSSKGEANESHSEDECGKGCTCGKCEKCTEEYLKEHGISKDEAGEEPKKAKHSRSHYEGAAHVVHHALKDKHDKSELAEHMKKHMKKIYGDDYDEKKAEHAIKKATGVKSKSEDTEDEEEDAESRTFHPVRIMGSEAEYNKQEEKREKREAEELRRNMKKAGLLKKK